MLSQLSQINNYLQHLSELCRQQQFDDIVQKLLGENQVETDRTRLKKRRHLKLPEATSFASASNISIVQPPESNSEVRTSWWKAIKDRLQPNYILSLSKLTLPFLVRRLNIWAFVLSS